MNLNIENRTKTPISNVKSNDNFLNKCLKIGEKRNSEKDVIKEKDIKDKDNKDKDNKDKDNKDKGKDNKAERGNGIGCPTGLVVQFQCKHIAQGNGDAGFRQFLVCTKWLAADDAVDAVLSCIGYG